ncbi:MAG: hypothetical protein M3Y08_07355 [Fibrobacterota bacterium]|nr:hypothetical protein [Fibrobacterota bacterium]
MELVLRPPSGNGPLDVKIKAVQKHLRGVPTGSPRLEELGWLFVAKARSSFDDNFYLQAENCALLLDHAKPGSPAGLLLKGHVLVSTHRFAEAEAVAKTLVAARGLGFDYALLGDALMEQGRLDSALTAYQAMMDRKPGYQAYARAAHMRWLHGDVEGASDMMHLAVTACSPRDAEAMAWAYTKHSAYQFQLGQKKAAKSSLRSALGHMPNFPPAQYMRGRISLQEGRTSAAVSDLTASTRAHSLPETQWALAEALRSSGRPSSADSVESLLSAGGARMDPRTLSLFLATRKRSTQEAHSLALRELAKRGDVFTHDAVAWAAYASGDLGSAASHADSAMARGTKDPRMSLHAGLIAKAAGRTELARTRLGAARAQSQLLLPSERRLLDNALARPAGAGAATNAAAPVTGRTADSGPALR